MEPGTDATADVTNGFLMIKTRRIEGDMSLVLRDMFNSGLPDLMTEEEIFSWDNGKTGSAQVFFSSRLLGAILDF